MIAALLGLLLASSVTIVGPGHLSYAGDGTLEAVAERRARNGWGVTGDWQAYDILAAPADCQLLDRSGWLIAGGRMMTVKIVDCENGNHRGDMAEKRLLADVNREELAHQRGWLVLR